MMDQNKPKGALLGAVLVIVAIGIYAFYANGLADKRDLVADELELKLEKLEAFEAEESEIASAQDEFDLTSSVEQFTSLAAIPSGLGQDEVVRTIVKIAADNDVDLKSVNFARSGAENDEVEVLRINSSFEGSYGDLIDFLEGLEDNERLFKVDNINAQVNRIGVSGLERVNFSLSIDTFFQK